MPRFFQPAAYLNMEVYEGGINYAGIAKIKLPEITHTTVTLCASGMMGKIDVPLLGAIENMELQMEFLSPTAEAVTLAEPRAHQLDLRVNEQYWKTQEAQSAFWPEKYSLIVHPKTFNPGNIVQYTASDASGNYSVYFYAAYRGGKQLWEIDKRNMRFVMNGTDYMREMRSNLGL